MSDWYCVWTNEDVDIMSFNALSMVRAEWKEKTIIYADDVKAMIDVIHFNCDEMNINSIY